MTTIQNNPHQEVEMAPNIEQANISQLYEAALKGSVETFATLIRSDSLILCKISLTSFTETPLHISALAGHLQFTEALLREKSELATGLDSRKRSPLHLASAEGHAEVVKALLRENKDACLARDEEGRIPLHLAVMRGQVEVIQELIEAQRNSVFEKLHGDTVLHLAVKFNQLNALRLLVTRLINDQYEILDFTDHLGNTVLHSAVMLKQSETITYLVSVPKIKAKINVLNKMRFSALDLLEQYPRDFVSLKVGEILIGAGSRRSMEDTVPEQSKVGEEIPCWSFAFIKKTIKLAYRKCKNYMTHQTNWVEDMQGMLMLVATVSATISFQVAISPPGGVLGVEDRNSTIGDIDCTTKDPRRGCVGTALLSYLYPEEFQKLMIYASISFIASLTVVLLAISGIPLKNKMGTWLMTIAMIISVTYLFLVFTSAVWMVTPDIASKVLDITQYTWIGLVGLVIVFVSIRFLFWLHRHRVELKELLGKDLLGKDLLGKKRNRSNTSLGC